MASTTYEHFVDVDKMYAAYGCFLDLTKTYHLGNVTVMVRNAGQLPQEENRYIDPYPVPRYPDVENGRRTPQIGFSQNGDWDKRFGQYERGGADSRSIKMPRQHLTHDEAEEWCDNMVNADGTKGCHWTLEQTQDVAKQRNITCDPNDFWAVMNMMYSDYCQVAKRQSVDTPGFYADMAKAFLEDTDAADGKAYLYWDCIADK